MADYSVSYSSGLTLYAMAFDPADRAWDGSAFVDPAGVRPTCAVAMTDDGLGTYTGDLPAGIPPGPTGTCLVRAYLRLGAAPDDADPPVGFATVTVPTAQALRTSDDADFLAGLIHTVAIEFDVNSIGSFAGAHPGRPANWQPVAGLEAVACRVVIKRSVPVENGSMRVGVVLFGVAIVADRRYSMLFTSGAFGLLRLYFTGPVIDAHEMGHHWIAEVQDRPL